MKQKIYLTFVLFLSFFSGKQLLAQNTLKMGTSGGPAGNGPAIAAQAVTLYENGTTAYSPAITVTYSLSNQQFGAGSVEGMATRTAMNFGGTINTASNTAMGTQSFYSLMNGISTPLSTMFSGCNNCGVAGIDVTTDRAISFFNCTDAFINPLTGVNTKALNARIYVGDITLTFNRPVSNPILQFVGLGGTTSITRNGKIYDLGLSTEFDLITNNVSLSKLAGNAYLSVTASKINNSATWLGSSSQGTANNGITRYAASGSILVQGTNLTSVSFKAFVRGDGGRVNNGSTVVSPDAGFTPLWAYGAVNPFGAAGNVSGDLMLFGVSLKKPVSVTGNVFKDPNGGNVNNSTGDANSVPSGMYANLVDANGRVVAAVAVNTNGTYSFAGVSEGNYSVLISKTAGTQGANSPLASLPSGWVNTGEYNGTPNTGNDGAIDGLSSVFTVAATNVTNINFAIEQTPTSPDLTYLITQPVNNSIMILNGTGLPASPAALNGTDPEDGNLGSGKTFKITVGGGMDGNKLYYNGVEITGEILIPNYNPALLAVKYCGAGSVNLSFLFQSFDAAGQPSNIATYSIAWVMALPATTFETTVLLNNNATAFVYWKTGTEQNTSRFYVERSTDNSNFTVVASVAAAGNSNATKNYSIQDDVTLIKATRIYYRIKLIDLDGRISFSNTVVISIAAINEVKVWPNPFIENISMSFYSETNATVLVKLTDASGRVVASTAFKVLKGNNQLNMGNLKNQPAGMYVLQIEGGAGGFKYVHKLMK